MKRFVAGVVVGRLSQAARLRSRLSNANHNGLFWNKLNRAAKDGYVNGYADAMRVSVSKVDTLTTAGDLFHWKGSRKIIHEVETQLSMSEVTPDDVGESARHPVQQSKIQRARSRHRITVAGAASRRK